MARAFAIAGAIVALAATPTNAINYLVAGCTEQSSRVINCEGVQITELPEGIASGFTKILAKNNYINDNSGTVEVRCAGIATPCGSGILTSAQLTNLANHPTMAELQLQGNGILYIADNAFSGYGNLDILRVFGNSLTEIQQNAFAGLTSLSTLYINNNPPLEAIRAGAFDPMLNTLTELFAKDNINLHDIEDGSINAFAPPGSPLGRALYVDMGNNPAVCMFSPDGYAECACTPGGTGGTSGFCEVTNAPTTVPTQFPTPSPTRAPTAAVAVTTTVAAAVTTTAPEENRQGDGGGDGSNGGGDGGYGGGDGGYGGSKSESYGGSSKRGMSKPKSGMSGMSGMSGGGYKSSGGSKSSSGSYSGASIGYLVSNRVSEAQEQNGTSMLVYIASAALVVGLVATMYSYRNRRLTAYEHVEHPSPERQRLPTKRANPEPYNTFESKPVLN